MLYRNKNPAGLLGNMLYGLAQITDGIVRIITFGTVATKLPLIVTRRQTQNHLKQLKKRNNR